MISKSSDRCHRFDNYEPEKAIPHVVVSISHFKLGFTVPMHPFFVEMLDFYELTPLELTPNSFRVVVCMYVLYE